MSVLRDASKCVWHAAGEEVPGEAQDLEIGEAAQGAGDLAEQLIGAEVEDGEVGEASPASVGMGPVSRLALRSSAGEGGQDRRRAAGISPLQAGCR